MALAPVPIFASFGRLTAVMIALSPAVSIVVLPGLLVALTPEREKAPEPAPSPQLEQEREFSRAAV